MGRIRNIDFLTDSTVHKSARKTFLNDLMLFLRTLDSKLSEKSKNNLHFTDKIGVFSNSVAKQIV